MALKFICLFFLLASAVSGFRVLMLATNVGYSHLEYTGRLADILVEAGHDVDYVVEVWHRMMKHNGTTKANVIRFETKKVNEIEILMNSMGIWGDSFEVEWDDKQMKVFGLISKLHCEGVLSDHKMLDYLKTRNYTVGMAESFDICAWSIFHLLGIKSVHELNAIPLPENSYFSHGIPFDFRNIPTFYSTKQVGSPSTYLEMLYNFYEYLNARYKIYNDQVLPTEEVFRRLIAPDHPSFAHMLRQSAYVWINTHQFVDFPRLNAPKVKHIGGIAVKKPQTLNLETSKIFERAKTGVVLVSFGSIVDTTHMKPKLRDGMLEAFVRFPDYEFIWRLTRVDDNITALVSQYPNVHVSAWLQQSAILAHPKTRGFISHMGLNSLNEATHSGVPLVAVPFFGDQLLNTAMALKRGVAFYLSRREITTESLSHALSQILHSEKYRQRSLDLKAKILNFPVDPVEMFVKHVEYAEKFGQLEELQLDTMDETIIEEFKLDLVALALVSIFLIYTISMFLLRRVLLFRSQLRVSRTKKVE